MERKQYRFTKEAQKIQEKKIIDLRVTVEDMINWIPLDDTVGVIKILDQSAEDWSVTEEAFKYFLSQIMLAIQDGDVLDESFYDRDLKRFVRLVNLKLEKK